MIVAGTWNAGAVSNVDNASQAYNEAIQTQVTNKKVGLIATYEFLYAAGSSCLGTSGYNYDSGCVANDWLKSSSHVWTLSPSSNNSNSALRVGSNGSVNYYIVGSSYEASPAVYLDSNITITGGNGEIGETDSYKLG